jgi:Flp pilus assembly protein TadB
VSKERARRRAEREAERARAIRANEERQARRARRRALIARLTPRPVRIRRQGGLLARRHRAQNAVVALGFLLVQVIAWLVWGSLLASFAVLVLSVLFVPVVVTLAFDRRT